MARRLIVFGICLALLLGLFSGCGRKPDTVKLGVSFGVGAAPRWASEQVFMEERAKELGIEIETRLNTTDTPKTQLEDCRELIDSGIDVLIYIPRDASKAAEVISYAKQKKVAVLNYARIVLGDPVDLFVGYDSERIGQMLGQYLTELVYTGDYILLSGDPNDNNATLLYNGAMRYIDPIRGDINVILDAPVPGWSPEEAKRMVKDAVEANGGNVDAILAPNDTLAGACADALRELGVTKHVPITGMDANLDAARRIVAGTQDVTIYMDLQDLARAAVDEAYHIAKGEKVNINAEFNNQSGEPVPSSLIVGQLVTRENLNKILIDGGVYTREEVYGGSTTAPAP